MRGTGFLAIATAALLAACQAQTPALEAGFASFHEPERCMAGAGAPGAGVIAQDGCALANWRIEPRASAGPRALYTIVSLANGLCLETPPSVGALVRMEPCNGSAAQRILIDAFRRAPSAGAFDVVHTSAESDLNAYPGLILQSESGCLAMEPSGAITVQPCVDPVSGRFNPLTEWTLSPKLEAD